MEGEEALGLEQCAVFRAGAVGELIEDGSEFRGEGIGELMTTGGGGDAGEEEFEVVAGGAGVAVLLSDGFALFGEADGAVEGARGKRFQEAVGRAGPAADGAAAAMEELDLDPGGAPDLGEAGLGALEGPLARDDAGVLVGVGVADHDLLAGCTRATGTFGMEAEARAGDREFEEGAEEFGSAFQVLHGLEEGHDGQEADHAFGEEPEETRLAGEDIDREEVGEATGHADDERTEAIGSIGLQVSGEDTVRGEDGIGFRSGGGGRVEERSG